MELRQYQRAAIDSLYTYFSGSDGNPLVVMPTGTGKSVCIAAFLREAIEGWSDTRVLVLTHVKELIQQNFAALLRMWPTAPAGIYSAGLNKRDMHAQILFGGIQSIYKRAYAVQRCDLVLIDEAHLLSESESGMYRTFLKALREINPMVKVIGFTATPYRMKTGLLHEGENRIFTDICYDIPILDMIQQGYLCPVVPKQTKTQLDVSGVGMRGGEFIAGQLEAAVDIDHVNQSAVHEIVTLGEDRGSWLIFCSGVQHAKHIRDAIRARGIDCEAILGETTSSARDRILTDFKAGRLRALTNANVLTTGFDAPGVDLIALLRPTKSVGLYVQMLGRGTRLAEGKDNCLVLDFAGNTARHGPLDKVDGRTKKQPGEGDAPVKTCPACETICHASVKECPTCGHIFPPPEIQIDAKASTKAVLSTQIVAEWLEVSRVTYNRHEKHGGTPTMRVDYWCGLVKHSEWICFEHTGYPRQKACSWWNKRGPRAAVPSTVDDAIFEIKERGSWDGEPHDWFKEPIAIQVKPEGKYTSIVGVRFSE